MEPRREVSSVDLAAITHELGSITGAKVNKVYLYDDAFLRLRLRDRDRGRIELLLQTSDTKRVHTADPEYVPDAPTRPPNFAMMLRNRIGGNPLVEIEQYEFDRIIQLRFKGEEQTTIVGELFGEGNIIVLDATGKVVGCLETLRLKSRTVAPGSQYEFPASQLNPLKLDLDSFIHHMNQSETDIVRTLATQLNFGGLYAEELCYRAGVAPTISIDDATREEYTMIHTAIQELVDTLATGTFDPRVYYEDDEPVNVAPFPLSQYDSYHADTFDTFNAALDYYFRTATGETKPSGSPDSESRLEELERIITQQTNAITDFQEQANREREKADQLYAEYDLVDEIIQTINAARSDGLSWEEIMERFEEGTDRDIRAASVVSGINPETGTVTIDLDGLEIEVDPEYGVEKNADQLYQGAKDIREKRSGAKDALAETQSEYESLQSQLDAEEGKGVEGSTSDEDIEWRARRSIPIRKPDAWYDRFRWFYTSDDFLVLGGRNADQNEELVKKYMEPSDRFFHTEVHGAPATILKATDPSESARDIVFPESTLDEAAQFAVSYSSVWKDGRFAGDVYMVDPDQVSKTPESGEYVEKGSFVIRGKRTYFRNTPIGCTVGIMCSPETRVIGGPSRPIQQRAETWIEVEPGRYARGDVAKRVYREFRDRFADTSFVRRIASPDEIAKFLPPGGSRIIE